MTALTDEQLDQIYDKAYEANMPECGCHGAGLRAVAEAAVQAEREGTVALPELAEEGLAYFERAGDAGDKRYVQAIRAALHWQCSYAKRMGMLPSVCHRANPPQASATVPEEIAPADVPAYWQDKSSNACAYAAGWNNCARAMLAASQPDAGKADDIDPCPGCRKGAVCRTPSCGRLKLPLNHPYRTGQQNAGKVGK